MSDVLNNDNKHLLLESTDNSNNSFIANINRLASKLDFIIQAVDLFDENIIPVLEEISELDLKAAIEDLEKGSYLGNRKVDINLLYNMIGIDKYTDEAKAKAIWLDPTKTVMYSGATALFKDGTTIRVNFKFDGNNVNISTHADLLLQLNSNTAFLNKLNNTLISSFAYPVVGEILRIYDVDGLASNLDRLTLHAVRGKFIEANVNYYWTKTTSSLQTLAMRVGDIAMIGSNIESFISLANNITQLMNLQNRIPELVDTYTNNRPNGDVTIYNNLSKLIAIYNNLDTLQLIHSKLTEILTVEDNIDAVKEVSDNIIPHITEILASYNNALEAKNYANEAKAYRNDAASSAITATTKANEIKSVSVGSTATAIAGSNASVVYDTVTGKFHFVIPQGIKGDKGDAFAINARGVLSSRSLYNGEVTGFSFLATDTSTLYFKINSSSGNWSEGVQFGKGDKGDKGNDGNSITSVTFLSTTSPSNMPNQPGGLDTYRINFSNSTNTTFSVANGESFQLSDSTSKVYVSKQGSNSNSGLTIEKPKFSIAAAITVASSLLAGSPRVVVEVIDASRYQENITIPQNIMLKGEDATLEGTVVLNNNSYFNMYGHYASTNNTVMVSKLGNSHSYYKVVIQDAGGVLNNITGCTNIRNNATNSIMFVEIELQRVSTVGIKEETASGSGHIHIRIKDMYLITNNAVGISGTGVNSNIIGYIDHILILGAITGTKGIYFNSTNGNIDITSNEIISNTACEAIKGSVKLNCPRITGLVLGTVWTVLTTENLSHRTDLDSISTPASSRAVKTVKDYADTKAPGGFGLGSIGGSHISTTLNNIREGGFYGLASSPSNTYTDVSFPVVLGTGTMLVMPRGNITTQFYFCSGGYARRVYDSPTGTWSDFILMPNGITNEITSTSNTVAASALAVKTVNDKIIKSVGFIGDIRLLPYRPSDLVNHCPGWYFCNGSNYALSSLVGSKLNSLPANFKTDWGITVSGSNISIPNMFHSDGRGYFTRSVNGTARIVGNVEQDAMQGHRHGGSFASSTLSNGGGSSGWYNTANAAVVGDPITDNVNGVPRTGIETRSLNIGMTPAIFLDV